QRSLKSPEKTAFRQTVASDSLPPLRRSSKIPRAPESPAARAAPTAPARFPRLAGRDPSPKLFPWSAAWRSLACDRPCRPSHPHTSLQAECAASPESRPTEPAYAVRSKLKCPDRPVPFRLPPSSDYGSSDPRTGCDSRLPGTSTAPERPLPLSIPPIL